MDESGTFLDQYLKRKFLVFYISFPKEVQTIMYAYSYNILRLYSPYIRIHVSYILEHSETLRKIIFQNVFRLYLIPFVNLSIRLDVTHNTRKKCFSF